MIQISFLHIFIFLYKNKNDTMDKILKQFGKDKIIESVRKSNSFTEVTTKLGLDPKKGNVKNNVRRCINRLNISTEHFESIKRINSSKNRWDENRLKELVIKCKNLGEILYELDILPISTNYKKLKIILNKYNINYAHLKNNRPINRFSWNINNLTIIIKNSKTQKEVLEKMGLRAAGSNFKTLKKYIELYKIDTEHFIKNYDYISNLSRKNKISLNNILTENSSYNRDHLKKRLYKEGLKERKCEICGQDEYWNGKHMSLILDHINGINNDNRLENLRIVCPNCNATLDTHCGKNKFNKIKKEKSNIRLNRRKVERPSYEQLMNEIKQLGYSGTGRKYGVSDNAIRKWILKYE